MIREDKRIKQGGVVKLEKIRKKNKNEQKKMKRVKEGRK